MIYQEKRKEIRIPLKVKASYERINPDGSTGASMSVILKDLSPKGTSFYSSERISPDTCLRMALLAGKNKVISFGGRVERSMFHGKQEMNYIVGVSITEIEKKEIEEIKKFLDRIDINSILDTIDLSNVVDVHFIAGYPPIIKKLGKLFTWGEETFDDVTLCNLLLSTLDEDRYISFVKEKEMNFVFTARRGVRFRVNLHIQQGKVEGVFRLIPSEIDSPSKLGLPKVAESLLMNERGLILVSGRTGSGKTTTLAAMVEFLNTRRNGIIICIEDPIEYVHENKKCIIKQREIGKDTFSFYKAAKNALRQNPDILVVGEILDMETMETAITAAETGALVLTSIHAGNATQTLDRVASFFPADRQKHFLRRLSLILRGVIAQELIPRKDEQGLALATEILIANSAVRQLIRNAGWQQIPSLIQVNRSSGMISMKDSLETLYNKGLISQEYLKEKE